MSNEMLLVLSHGSSPFAVAPSKQASQIGWLLEYSAALVMVLVCFD